MTRDVPHARAEQECATCRETYVAYAFLAPDPTHHANQIVNAKIASWARSHPCNLATAHPKRNHRGPAA